jgi:ABC-2 type transport system permease protein
MNLRIIGSLVSKDFSLFFRNRFFAGLTVLGIVIYLVIYFVMPRTVDESLNIGLYSPVKLPALEQIEEEGLEIEAVESEEKLKEAVFDGQYVAGIAIPADIIESLNNGQKPHIKIYFAADTPQEIKDAVELIMRELIFEQTGQSLAIEVTEEVLGPDLAGAQIPPRDRLRPLFAVLLIMAETFGMANLISDEIQHRTIQALLVTPMTVKELFIAKGITGTSLAFFQAIFFMAIVGGLNVQPLIILLALLLGAVLVTGVSFIIAALGKDVMSVMAWGVIVFIIMVIPSVGVMFPGTISGWVKVIPTYYLVDTVHQAANFGSGWGDIWSNLLVLTGFDLVLIWAGIIILRRKSL